MADDFIKIGAGLVLSGVGAWIWVMLITFVVSVMSDRMDEAEDEESTTAKNNLK